MSCNSCSYLCFYNSYCVMSLYIHNFFFIFFVPVFRMTQTSLATWYCKYAYYYHNFHHYFRNFPNWKGNDDTSAVLDFNLLISLSGALDLS